MPIGIDIVDISRIKLDDKFIDFVLTENEKNILFKRVKKEEFIAGRWAVKEAFLKANKKGIGEIPFNQIDVQYEENGNPIIFYNNTKYENVSISHDGNTAIGMVIIL